MARNGFQGPDHEFVRDDAMHFLQGRGRQAAFDLAVVDAPTFSNSKSLEDYWDIQRNHVELLNRLVELMAPGGPSSSRRTSAASSWPRRRSAA